MEHNEKFEKVKENFECGFWNLNMVRKAVAKNWITVDEYEEITGEKYN